MKKTAVIKNLWQNSSLFIERKDIQLVIFRKFPKSSRADIG